MNDPAPEWRQERIARNEASFRLINERLEDAVSAQAPTLAPVNFVCECGSRRCQDVVRLTLTEYEAVRARGNTFAVLPGHEIPDTERVVERFERYTVVEKIGLGGLVSQITSPRRHDSGATDADGEDES
jgi:hypothetical protein